MQLLQSIKNLFSKRKPYTMPERNTAMNENDFRRAIERMETGRDSERQRALRRYENAYRTPRPISTTIDDIWGSTATTSTYPPSLTGTYQDPQLDWRRGPTINPFSPDWIGSPFAPKEPLPKYQILSSSLDPDPLNQTTRIAIEGVGIFRVSVNELVNSDIEELVRGLVKMGPKKALHIVVIGVISV